MDYQMWDWLIWAFMGGVTGAMILLWLQEYYLLKFSSRKRKKENISKFIKRHQDKSEIR